jgi:dipeptidase E
MYGRIIVAGGGGQQDSLLLDQRFAEWIGTSGRMLYWPMALPETHPLRTSCFDWIHSVFEPLGVQQIEMWTDFFTHGVEELDSFDALYIGGGNTYLLLHLLRSSGFDAALSRFLAQGRAVYGGSAGAAMLGRDIETVAHMDRNTVALKDIRGLDVLEGHSVWCHYTPDDDVRIHAYIEARDTPVLAIGERAGVAVEDGRFTALGYEPVVHFTKREIAVVDAGQEIDMSTSHA